MNFKTNIHEEVSKDEITVKTLGDSEISINNENNPLQGRISENEFGTGRIRTWSK